MMTPHPEAVLRAGVLDRPRLARFARTVKSFDELDPAVGMALAERIEPGESVRQVIAAPKQAVLPVRREKWLAFERGAQTALEKMLTRLQSQ